MCLCVCVYVYVYVYASECVYVRVYVCVCARAGANVSSAAVRANPSNSTRAHCHAVPCGPRHNNSIDILLRHHHHSMHREGHGTESDPPGLLHLPETPFSPSGDCPVEGQCMPMAASPPHSSPSVDGVVKNIMHVVNY